MSNIFTPKRVPGLLTDDEMALGMKDFVEQQKSAPKPLNTSALEFADKTIGNAAAELRRTTDTMPEQKAPLTGAESAGQDRLQLDKKAPSAGILGGLGMLEPGGAEQAAEHEIIIRGATRDVRTAVEDESFREAQAAGLPQPEPTTDPGELKWRQEQAAKAAAERAKPLEEATEGLQEAVSTPPTQTWWRNAMDVGVRSAAQTGVSMANGPVDLWELTLGRVMSGGDIKQSPAGEWLDAVDKSITQMLPGDPVRSKEFVSELSAGAGSMAAFLLAGYIGSVFGMPAGAASSLAGASAGANQQYEDSERFSAHGLQKYLSFFGGAALGATEGIPLDGALRRAIPWDRAFFDANTASNGMLLRMLNNTAASSMEEFIQEFSQAAGEDLIARFVYDPKRELDVLDWAKQGLIGGIVGGGMGTVTSVLGETGALTADTVDAVNPEQQQKIAETVYAQGQAQLDAILGRRQEASEVEVPAGAGAAEVASPAGAEAAAAAPGAAGARLSPALLTARQREVAGISYDPVVDYVTMRSGPRGAETKTDTTALTQLVRDTETGLDPESDAARAISEFIGHEVDTQIEHGIMNAGRLEAIARGENPQGLAELETAFAPVREALRTQFGDTIKLFRMQRQIAPNERGAIRGSAPQDGKRATLSWTTDQKFARDYAGVTKDLPIVSEAQITAYEAEFEANGRVKIGRNWLVREEGSRYPGIFPDRMGEPAMDDMVTDTDSVRAYIESDNEWATEQQARNDEREASILSADVPIDDILWVSDRAGQSEFIVRNDPEREVFVDETGTMRPPTPKAKPADPRIVAAVQSIQLEPSETMPLPALEKGLTGPIQSVVSAARAYADAVGMPHRRARSYVKVDTARAARIAQAYADMKHEPADPAVQAAYRAMAEETIAQYQFVKATGIKIETIKEGQPDPYPNGPRDVLKDIAAGHIWYFPTDQGFGSSDFDASDNPLLEPTQEVSDNGVPMVVNDLFRVVHDFFGHGLEGSGFGARGEENAWQSHMRLYSATAVPAMTSETRGQNSWVNYGPFGEQNRANPRETVYADQKTGIMPSWTWQEGVEDSHAYDLDAPIEMMVAFHASPHAFNKFELASVFGSGEGNADFGYGLYFSDGRNKPNEGARKFYRDTVAGENGREYQVDIPESFEMLYWDVPFEEQSTLVQSILTNMSSGDWTDMTGSEIYYELANLSGSEKFASQRLANNGILGHRYRDAGSRDAGMDESERTFNYVVYAPEAVSIVKIVDLGTGAETVPPLPADQVQYEAPPTTTRFVNAIVAAKNASPFGAKVHVYDFIDYNKMRLFLSPDSLSGFALKEDGDIVSVFSHPQAGGGRLQKILDTAIANGGKKLDAFDGKLVELYSTYGFKEVSREPWNDAFKPEGWQDDWGTPDVVFMEFEGEDQSASYGTESAAFKEWDDGAAIRMPSRGDPYPGADGDPVVLYSGSPLGFRRASRAMWLTPDRETATNFGDAQAGKGRDAEFDEDGANIGGNVFSFYARMENPYEVDFEGSMWNEGPQTEWPEVYYVNVTGRHREGPFDSYGDAQTAMSELEDRRAEEAREDREQELAERVYVAPVGDGPLFDEGSGFEVRLKSENSALIAKLRTELEGYTRQLQQTIERRDTAVRLVEEGRAAPDIPALIDDYNSRSIPSLEGWVERLMRDISAREAEGTQDEVLATFETEEEARDFETSYTEEQLEAAESEARDNFDADIDSETDYDNETGNANAQTTDREVAYAEANGYDGVIFRNVDEGNGPVDVYVVISPGNAKSTANRGTYNRNDPDILFMAGTNITRKAYGLEPTRPAQGIPDADPNAEPVDATLSGISKNLADLLDLTVRQKLRSKEANVMGEYHRNSAVVRLRTWTDLSTLAHEAGHALNDAVMQDPAMAQFLTASSSPLRKIAQQLYQVDLSNAPAATRQREGFAEFFRVYTLTPQYARKHWPQLTADFEAAVKNYDSRLLDGLAAIADQFAAWINMPSTDLMRGMVVSGYRDTGVAAAIKELREAGVTTWMREVATRSAAWVVNRYAPLNQLIDELLAVGEQNRGVPLDLNRADDPRVMARLLNNTANRANISITSGVIGYRSLDSTTHSLQDVLLRSQGAPLGETPNGFDEQRHKDFTAYLVARRSLAEFERYEAGELERPPIDATKGEVTRAIKDFEAKYKDSFTEAAAWAHEYGMGLWQLQYDAGLMTRETYEEGRKRTFYVPLQRDISDKKLGLGASALTAGDRLLPMGRRFRGSSRQIIDPMAVLMEKTFALEKAIAINDAKRSIALLADKAGKAGALVERVPATQLIGQQYSVRQVASKLLDNDEISEIEAADMMALIQASYDKEDAITLFRSEQAMGLGQNALYFWENGKVAAILVKDGDIGRDIVNTMNAVGRENMDLVTTALASTSAIFREAIRLWPDFLVMNFLRDQPSAWVLTEGYIPFVDSIRGAFDEVTQRQIAKSYNASRGTLGGMSNAALHVSRVNRDIRTLTAKGYTAKAFGDVQHGWDIPGILRGLSRFTELTETGTRFGVYRRAYNRATKEGLKPFEAGVEAAYIATDLMDFGLNGSKMMTSRRLIPFLNAQLQGLYKLYRTLGADEVGRRRGLKYVMGAYFKDINKLPISRVEKQQVRVGRKAWLKMLSLGIISAALHFLFEDDPDYQETSEYLRSTGWVIPTGKPGEIFYMPKPFEIAVFANAVERFMEFAGGDQQALSRFMRGLALTAAPPTDVPLLELGYGLATNTDIFSGAPIVPEHMQGHAPYLQFDHRTSNLAKWLGAVTGQSPMVTEHIMSSLFASAYRDVSRTIDAMDPSKPAMEVDDAPMLRRLVRDARRGGVSSQDFYREAGERQSTLSRALSTYKQEIDAGNEVAANANLARMRDDEKAYALLMTHFKAEEKRMHPFYRTQQVVGIINKMRREIGSPLSLQDTTNPDDAFGITMPARQKAEVDNVLSEIIRRETRNAMIVMKQPGWADKEVLPLQETLDLMAATAPDVYYELERRYAKARVYSAEGVADAWPEVKDRLLFDRDAADLTDLVVLAQTGL